MKNNICEHCHNEFDDSTGFGNCEININDAYMYCNICQDCFIELLDAVSIFLKKIDY